MEEKLIKSAAEKGLKFEGGASDIIGGISGAMGAVGQISSNLKSAKELDERGNRMGKVDAVGNTLAAAGAGAQLGSMFGPIGAGIGAGAGALFGGITSLTASTPSADDMIFKEGEFQLGQSVSSYLPEDAFAKQQLMAKNGMNVDEGGKTIEVERDEVVLRKRGKSFVKVADFKTGKTHEQGGEDYKAEKGDIIMPGKLRNKVNTLLRGRKWSSIESMRLKLPRDSGQPSFAEGTSSIEDPSTPDKSKTPNIPEYLFNSLVNNGLSKTAARGLIVNLAYETNDFKNLEEIGTNVHGTKGYGLAQWTDSPTTKRRTAFENYLEENNTDVTDLEANVGFLISELKGEQDYNVGLSMKTLNSAKSVKEAANMVLTKFERPHDQSEEHLNKRIKRSSKFLEETKKYTPPKSEEVKQVKEEIKSIDEEQEFWKNQSALRHRGSTKGKAASLKNKKAKENFGGGRNGSVSPEDLEAAGEEVRFIDKFNFWVDDTVSSAAMGLGYAGNQLVDFFTGSDSQDSFDELKFEDTPEGKVLEKEYQDVIFNAIDDEETLSLAGLTDSANFISKWSTNLLTAQSTSGTDLYRGANLLSMYDEDGVNSIRAKLKEKGISKEGMFLFEDMTRSPQNYYSSNIKGADAIDALTLLMNPMGAVNGTKSLIKAVPAGAKMTGRLVKSGIDTGAKATVWTAKKAKTALKALKEVDWKTAPKKLWDGVDKMLQDAPMYAKGEDMFSILNEAEKLSKTTKNSTEATELGKKVRTYKSTYEDVISLAKKGRNNLSKIVYGSSFDDLKTFRQKVKSTTGLEWKEASKLTKTELANATKRQMKGFESEVDAWNTKMKSSHAKYKAKKEELLQKVDADGKAFAENHPEVVKLNKELDDIATKMDKLDVMGETLKKRTPMAFDKDYNILDVEIQVPGSPQVTEDSKLYAESYKSIVRNMDNMNDSFQRTQNLKTAKTAEQLADFEKTTAGVVDKSLTNITKESNKALRPLMKGKQEALGKIENLEQLQKEFPEIYNSLAKAKRLNDIPKNAAGFKSFMDVLSNEPPGDGLITGDEEEEVKPKMRPEAKAGEWSPAGVKVDDDSSLPTDIIDNGLEMDRTKTPKKEGKGLDAISAVGDVISGIADYAPAIYNISKGMGGAAKAERNYVNPAMEQYENNSQAQLNSIDDAFSMAIGNSRNLSGGLASNFRANVEKAHADKLGRTSQVNAQETQVATGVANRNVQSLNQAKQFNANVDNNADQMDARAVASRNSFLGQGINDVANITAVKNKDKAAEKNQGMLYDLMMNSNKR